MADLKKPLNQDALDALTLNSEEARAAYREQRLTLEAARAIRHDRTQRDLKQIESADQTALRSK